MRNTINYFDVMLFKVTISKQSRELGSRELVEFLNLF